MPRKRRTPNLKDLLEVKLSELTALIKDLSPQAHIEISFEQYEDEDAHVHVYPPPGAKPEEAMHIELAMGERCNEVLVETGLFIIGAVCD